MSLRGIITVLTPINVPAFDVVLAFFFFAFPMRCLINGSDYAKIFFVKSLTSITEDHLQIYFRTAACLKLQ